LAAVIPILEAHLFQQMIPQFLVAAAILAEPVARALPAKARRPAVDNAANTR
jgi:hypothetical protein